MVKIKENKLIKLLFSAYSYSPGYYLLTIVLMMVFGLTVPLFIEIQKRIIDKASHYNTDSNILNILMPLLIGYFIFYFIDTVSSQISTITNVKIMHHVEKKIMQKYLDDVSNMVFQAFEDAETQNILMRVSQKQREEYSKASTFFPNIIRRVIELAGIFYFVAKSGVWWAFPLSIVISLPSFYFNKKRTEYARKVWNKDSFDIRYADYLNETLLNREAAIERRFFGFYKYLSNIWESKFQAYNKNKINTFIKSSVATGVAMCFSMSTIMVLGLALLNPLKEGEITIGLYTAILIAVSSKMNMSISAIIREYSNITDMKHFLEDSQKLEQIEKINIEPVTHSEMIEFESIVFDDVWFAYPNTNKYILKGVTFEIKKNERHALIGVNGAGKTTITKLMLGLYSPSKGTIYLNGKDIKSYKYSQLQTLFAAVEQNFAKYKDSLCVNVCLYDLSSQKYDYDKLDETLYKCETRDILAKCKNDYNTLLTPEFTDGIMLSGGEWQKVAISRAFYSNRNFIIFDEPTAALDPLAEVKFYDTYNRIMTGHTCLFITHRLGSTYLFENCFVLSDGKIAERGSHSELMKQNGIYRELYEKQKGWYQEKESSGKMSIGKLEKDH